MLNICVSADHELFLGENFLGEEEVVILPTDKLMDVLQEAGAGLTLFTDVCSIWRYRELGLNDFPDQMERQLLKAKAMGHDVQLHVHPHWIRSHREGDRWQYDPQNFRMHSFRFGKGNGPETSGMTADEIVAKGKRYLDRLLQRVDAEYECVAFRAGGWCLQPEKEYLDALLREGIWIDSTIYKDGYSNNATHFYDFTRVPDEINWWIDPELGINEIAEPRAGRMFEVTIGSYSGGPRMWLLKLRSRSLKKRRRLWDNASMRGRAVDNAGNREKLFRKLSNFVRRPILFSYDGATAEEMYRITEYYLSKFDCSSQEYYLSLIGHPKSIGDANLIELGRYVRQVRKNLGGQVSFKTFAEVGQALKEQITYNRKGS